MKKVMVYMICLLLLLACGQSYEDTKRLFREQRREAQRKDSAALKIAVMPTLDCLPLYVAEHYQLLDTMHGGVRLKHFNAHMDCDTALERGRVEGAMTDLVRAECIGLRGLKLRYVAATGAHWKLVTNRTARIRQLKQLDDKMVAMSRFSASDLLTDCVVDSVKLDKDRVFKVQINDVGIRLLMLQNNEMDALWMQDPYATAAIQLKNYVVYDTQQEDIMLGVLAFREKEMQRQVRHQQLDLLVRAYDQACDSINKYGVRHYCDLIVKHCKLTRQQVDSLPDKLRFQHARGPREKDIAVAKKWLGKVGKMSVKNDVPKEKSATKKKNIKARKGKK